MNLYSLPVVLSLVTAVLIPGAASLLSRRHWPVTVTAALTMLLSTVSGFASEWAAHPHAYSTPRAALMALAAYVLAALARGQFWRGSKLDKALLAAGSKG